MDLKALAYGDSLATFREKHGLPARELEYVLDDNRYLFDIYEYRYLGQVIVLFKDEVVWALNYQNSPMHQPAYDECALFPLVPADDHEICLGLLTKKIYDTRLDGSTLEVEAEKNRNSLSQKRMSTSDILAVATHSSIAAPIVVPFVIAINSIYVAVENSESRQVDPIKNSPPTVEIAPGMNFSTWRRQLLQEGIVSQQSSNLTYIAFGAEIGRREGPLAHRNYMVLGVKNDKVVWVDRYPLPPCKQSLFPESFVEDKVQNTTIKNEVGVRYIECQYGSIYPSLLKDGQTNRPPMRVRLNAKNANKN